MKRCDRCGFETHGCAPGLEFASVTIDDVHIDMCKKCIDEYWEEMRKWTIPFKQQWLKDMRMRFPSLEKYDKTVMDLMKE